MSTQLPPPLGVKPRWDKYDGYVGNFRGTLADDIDLPSEANKVLAVGLNSDGAIVVGSGQDGVKGLMIVAVGVDIHGNFLEGGINAQAGDPQDVGKHGEITNFAPSDLQNDWALTVTAVSGNFNIITKSPKILEQDLTTYTGGVESTGPNIAYNAVASAVKTGVVGADDVLTASDITVVGTNPNFVVTLPFGWTLEAGSGCTVAANQSATPAAGTSYFAHADGSVTATKGSDGVYIGHTVEATRLIVNVDDDHN